MIGNRQDLRSERQRGSVSRLIKTAALLFTAMSVGTSAVAQECVPLEPKQFTGDFVVPGGGFVSTGVFEKGGCTWNGLDALNGFDAWVFDVTGYGGQPATVAPGAAGEQLDGFFLNEACERSGFTPTATTDLPATVAIPAEAKWIVTLAHGGFTATSVTVEILGRECETEEPKKKKKKKKGRGNRSLSVPNAEYVLTYL